MTSRDGLWAAFRFGPPHLAALSARRLSSARRPGSFERPDSSGKVLCPPSALYGISIRFDIVARIDRPETDSPGRGPATEGIWRGAGDICRNPLELYAARRIWYSDPVCHVGSLGPRILRREPSVRRGKELSRDGADHQGR